MCPKVTPIALRFSDAFIHLIAIPLPLPRTRRPTYALSCASLTCCLAEDYLEVSIDIGSSSIARFVLEKVARCLSASHCASLSLRVAEIKGTQELKIYSDANSLILNLRACASHSMLLTLCVLSPLASHCASVNVAHCVPPAVPKM